MLVNRVGDFGLARGIRAIYVQFKSLDYATVFAIAPTAVGSHIGFIGVQVDTLTCMCLRRFIGAVGKSAQLGLHT
jgi:NADH-quinone oxidoreductase subunit L